MFYKALTKNNKNIQHISNKIKKITHQDDHDDGKSSSKSENK